MSRPEKHSLTLRGHRTSVSLEPEFWAALRALAQRRGLGINDLAAQIDATRADTGLDPDLPGRPSSGPNSGLATAIRLEILRDLQTRAT